MRTVYIYVLKHPVTSEIRYVGLTRVPARRLSNEVNYPHTKHFANWIASLKSDGLKPKMEIIDEAIEGDEACGRERKWIAEMRSRGCRLLNFTDGGENGFKMSQEVVEKLRILNSRKRRPMSLEHKAAISAGNRGKKKPWASQRLIALNKSRTGVPLSDATKQKLSEIGKKQLVGEWKARFVAGQQSCKHSSKFTDQQKAEIKLLIAEGYSQCVIAKQYNASQQTIFEVKKGKYWKTILPANSAPLPPHREVSLSRNERGQYERCKSG